MPGDRTKRAEATTAAAYAATKALLDFIVLREGPERARAWTEDFASCFDEWAAEGPRRTSGAEFPALEHLLRAVVREVGPELARAWIEDGLLPEIKEPPIRRTRSRDA